MARGEAPDHARALALVALVTALAVVLAALAGRRNRAAMLVAAAAIGSALLLALTPLGEIAHLHRLGWGAWAVAAAAGALPAAGALLLRGRRG